VTWLVKAGFSSSSTSVSVCHGLLRLQTVTVERPGPGDLKKPEQKEIDVQSNANRPFAFSGSVKTFSQIRDHRGPLLNTTDHSRSLLVDE
jgi:hypothetical protein